MDFMKIKKSPTLFLSDNRTIKQQGAFTTNLVEDNGSQKKEENLVVGAFDRQKYNMKTENLMIWAIFTLTTNLIIR